MSSIVAALENFRQYPEKKKVSWWNPFFSKVALATLLKRLCVALKMFSRKFHSGNSLNYREKSQ